MPIRLSLVTLPDLSSEKSEHWEPISYISPCAFRSGYRHSVNELLNSLLQVYLASVTVNFKRRYLCRVTSVLQQLVCNWTCVCLC